jgi:hypothetical protein
MIIPGASSSKQMYKISLTCQYPAQSTSPLGELEKITNPILIALLKHSLVTLLDSGDLLVTQMEVEAVSPSQRLIIETPSNTKE